MTILFIFGFILVGIIWLLVELALSPNLNSFLDVKIMRRTVWLWLPFYAFWSLSKDIIFNKKK
jgi:hypothetical protein